MWGTSEFKLTEEELEHIAKVTELAGKLVQQEVMSGNVDSSKTEHPNLNGEEQEISKAKISLITNKIVHSKMKSDDERAQLKQEMPMNPQSVLTKEEMEHIAHVTRAAEKAMMEIGDSASETEYQVSRDKNMQDLQKKENLMRHPRKEWLIKNFAVAETNEITSLCEYIFLDEKMKREETSTEKNEKNLEVEEFRSVSRTEQAEVGTGESETMEVSYSKTVDSKRVDGPSELLLGTANDAESDATNAKKQLKVFENVASLKKNTWFSTSTPVLSFAAKNMGMEEGPFMDYASLTVEKSKAAEITKIGHGVEKQGEERTSIQEQKIDMWNQNETTTIFPD
ncbi:unnamed protein product, partial [Gongylonema pulchrum]|uniref:Uncharacterized protein n=1 Tax=Gongylonema pulchrum TaxID=637853 RepID=A0A183DLR1_9BILA